MSDRSTLKMRLGQFSTRRARFLDVEIWKTQPGETQMRRWYAQVGDKKFTNFNDVRDEIERQTDQVAGVWA